MGGVSKTDFCVVWKERVCWKEVMSIKLKKGCSEIFFTSNQSKKNLDLYGASLVLVNDISTHYRSLELKKLSF